jgi:porphobilinogen synthase
MSFDLTEDHLRRSLSHPVLRRWQSGVTGFGVDIDAACLILPVFVSDVPGVVSQPVAALAGVSRHSVDAVVDALREPVADGLQAILLFGVITDPARKDPRGLCGDDAENPVVRALPLLRAAYPHLLLVVDVCLCPYADHGHCGILAPTQPPAIPGVCGSPHFDAEQSAERLGQMAAAYAVAGAHVAAPSAMMDGMIRAIRKAVDARQSEIDHEVSIMAYAAKFASKFYGPFRDAAQSSPTAGSDRSGYQLPPSSSSLALRAILRDAREGADMIMVKPGLPYADIIALAREKCPLPIACYQVSGEHAMIWHAAQAGAFRLQDAVLETVTCLQRAGANIVISYFTPQILKWKKGLSV